MRRTVHGWNTLDVSTEDWQDAVQGPAGEPKDYNSPNQGEGHNLRPSTLPQMELTPQRFAAVRQASGVRVPEGFLEGRSPLTIPAHTTAELLLDQRVLTNAYFNLTFSGGLDATIHIGYAEALYRPSGNPDMPADMPARYVVNTPGARPSGKGNRDEVDGKVFIGREDLLISDGSAGQRFTTLSWRTWRDVRIHVETAGEALTLDDLSGTFTG